MNRLAVAAAVWAVLVALGGAARASSEHFYRMYDVAPASLDPRAVEAAARVAQDCNYSMLSRIGPRPEEMLRCNAAEEKLVALAASGARAALAALDDENVGHGARARLYDVMGRIGDLALVEPLVRGLEREEAAGLGNPRQMERSYIATTLTALTYAELKGTPAIQWRAWLRAHPAPSRAALLAERAAEVDKMVASGDYSEVFQAAEFLGSHQATRARARKIFESLLTRTELDYDQRRALHRALDRLPLPAPTAAAKPQVHPAQAAEVPRS
jgi:hypothetical protein